MKQLNPSRKFSLFAVAAIVSTLLVTTQLPLAAQNPVLDQSMTRLSVNLMHRIHNGFQVYWYAPLYNSDDVTDYDLQYREYDAGTSTWGEWTDKAHTGTGRMALITGLTAGKKYQTRIRWWIGNRYSRWSIPQDDSSDTREARNFQSARQPDPPTLPTVTVSAGKFTVSWTNPGTSNNSVATTGYRVRWRRSGSSGQGPLLASTATSYDVTGLVDGEEYEVWVRAYAGSKSTGSPIAGRFTFQAIPPTPDPSTLTLTANPDQVTESASATTVTVTATLDNPAKTGGVPVTLTAATGTTATVTTDYTLPTVFTISEGSSSATATVTIVNNDLVEDQETLKLSATTTTSGIAVTGTTVTINDDDAGDAKVAFGNSATATSEYTASVNEDAGTIKVPVTISHLPAASTTFAIEVLSTSTAGSGDYSISVKSVTFASSSSDTAKKKDLQITITDDSIDDDAETIKLKIADADAVANDLGDHYTRDSSGATATVTIADNDAPGITLSRDRVELTEAAGTNNSATYTVKLNTQPSDSVTISASSDDDGAAAVSPSSRTFTSTNWNIAQTFTVTAQSDPDADDETATITHSATSTADASYNGVTYTDRTDKVEVEVTDDDTTDNDNNDNDNNNDDNNDNDNGNNDNGNNDNGNNNPPDNNDNGNGPPDVPDIGDISIDIGEAIADAFAKDAGLRALEISSGNLHFDPDTPSYQVDVPHNTSVVTVTATPNSFLPTITVNGRVTPPGRPSHEIVLSGDPTFVQVIVRATDGTTKAYTITVHRVDS